MRIATQKIQAVGVIAWLVLLFPSISMAAEGDLIRTIHDIVQSLREPIIYISAVAGLGVIVFALYKAATIDMSQGGRITKFKIAILFFCGVLLFNLSQVFQISAQSFFMNDYQVLSTLKEGGNNNMHLASSFVVGVVQVVGMIGIIKAITIAMKAEEQGGGFMPSIKVFFGASMALNINHLICFMFKTFSGTAISTSIDAAGLAC